MKTRDASAGNVYRAIEAFNRLKFAGHDLKSSLLIDLVWFRLSYPIFFRSRNRGYWGRRLKRISKSRIEENLVEWTLFFANGMRLPFRDEYFSTVTLMTF